MQAKLDELIRALDDGRVQFIAIEHLTGRQIEDMRAALEREVEQDPDRKAATADDNVERLGDRYQCDRMLRRGASATSASTLADIRGAPATIARGQLVAATCLNAIDDAHLII
jgi:hypothetical protein